MGSQIQGILAITIIVALPSIALAAPSFDCAKAAGIEKTICADSKLADADQKLATTYQLALSRLSVQAAQQFREGQRQWLRYVRTVCGPIEPGMSPDSQTQKNCVISQYENRQKILENSGELEGGKLLYYVSVYKEGRSHEQSDREWATLEITYAQIDRPSSPSDATLNGKSASLAMEAQGRFDPGGSMDIYKEVKFLTMWPSIMSFQVNDYFYGHGAPHGQPSSSTFHWLTEQNRELTAQDVFTSGSKWEEFLRTFCFQAVKHFGFAKSKDDLKGLVEHPNQWTFQKDGLEVDFNPYAVASYADGEPGVLIPWNELDAYLAKDSSALRGIN